MEEADETDLAKEELTFAEANDTDEALSDDESDGDAPVDLEVMAAELDDAEGEAVQTALARYRAVSAGVIREGAEMDSPKAGSLQEGAEIDAIETKDVVGTTRVHFDSPMFSGLGYCLVQMQCTLAITVCLHTTQATRVNTKV